ncbi:MAG: hypothetical protein OXC72_05545, partial [Roseovarius sp.]|nr:hypothetical protein [Roseovarius sp.]
MDTIDGLLDYIRDIALDETAKGTAFETLIRKWLVTDPVQRRRFERVQTYAEWCADRGEIKKDLGTDLVATFKGGGCAAIQTKLYQDSAITKAQLDSFIADTGRVDPRTGEKVFAERLFIETTGRSWSHNLEETIRTADPPFVRIGLSDLRASAVD